MSPMGVSVGSQGGFALKPASGVKQSKTSGKNTPKPTPPKK